MKSVLVLGAAGFIGTNLTIKLAEREDVKITLADIHEEWFFNIKKLNLINVHIKESRLDEYMDFTILKGVDVVYDLVSTNVPTTSKQHISQDMQANVLFSSKLFEACIKYSVKRVVFISSGGTVYGKEASCPLSEDMPTNPISSYGLQKITIEKLLYLYSYMYGLDYRIIRLANPYGPYQRPNGILGAVTTFTYKALKGETIQVYGDGTVVRDFIYIDDAINAILKIVDSDVEPRIFNLGSGYGTSINHVIETVGSTLGLKMNVVYKEGRAVDVPMNYLDIRRYEKYFGKLDPLNLDEGIRRTAEFMIKELL